MKDRLSPAVPISVRRGLVRRAARFGLAALLILAGTSAAALADEAPAQSIVLNRGESFLIKDVGPSAEPEVRTVDNPHTLIVNKQPDGSVLVLAADVGTQSVRVATSGGRFQTYTFTVRALINPDNPLVPGVAPPAISEALDRGAGPVVHRTLGSEAPAAPPVASAFAAGSPPAEVASASSAADDEAEIAPAPAGTPAPGAGMAPPVLPAQAAPARYSTNPRAPEPPAEEAAHGPRVLPEDTINLLFGSSRAFTFPTRIKRVSIADSTIADVQVVDPHQLILIGHKPGFTTLAVWDNQGHYEDCQVRVAQSGTQQVMLNVVIAELDHNKIENQGIDLSAALTHMGISLVGLPGQVATQYSAGTAINGPVAGALPSAGTIIPLLLSNNLTYGLAAGNNNIDTQGFFRYLETHSLARVLAQPRLVAKSGEEAKFLSGGEIPIVIAQALNTSVVFKQFGTSVVFVPTVVGKHDIELVVKPEVSKPDFTQGVQLFGFTVPAFLIQRAETVVKMRESQTLILAGLVQRQRTAQVQKVPYLGDIPYAGALFRNTSYTDDKTELMMTVTPQIVTAIPAKAEVVYPARGSLTQEEVRTAPVSPPDAARPRF